VYSVSVGFIFISTCRAHQVYSFMLIDYSILVRTYGTSASVSDMNQRLLRRFI